MRASSPRVSTLIASGQTMRLYRASLSRASPSGVRRLRPADVTRAMDRPWSRCRPENSAPAEKPITASDRRNILVGYRAGDRAAVIRSCPSRSARAQRPRASPDEGRRRVAGLTSIVRPHRPVVHSGQVRPRTLYQANVPRARLVPSPNPLFLVARARNSTFLPSKFKGLARSGCRSTR